jgi:predicted enzyme related to lactoylglutathione lyase
MFRGFATTTSGADDLAAARDWFRELLGIEPYNAYPPAPATPAYLEFRVGDDEDELGFVDRRYGPASASGPGGAVVFRHVDDLPDTLERLLALGATEYQSLTQREAGFATASVVDPFGNLLGVMHNPHCLEMLAARTVGRARDDMP